MESKLEEMRTDIWRHLYDGHDLNVVQSKIEEKYRGEFSTLVIATNISLICKKDFVAVEK